MQFHILGLFFLYQSLASGHPQSDQKDVTSVPDLVPSTTVHLSTDSTLKSQVVSPARTINTATLTTATTSATTTSAGSSSQSTSTSSASTTHLTGTNGGDMSSSSLAALSSTPGPHNIGTVAGNTPSTSIPDASSTSSDNAAGTINAVPLAGLLLVAALGL